MTLEVETWLEADPQLMAKLRATKTKYKEASKALHEIEEVIEKTLSGF